MTTIPRRTAFAISSCATIFIAAGLAVGAAPAHAVPLVPLAPACNQWGFPTGGNGIILTGASQQILFQAGGTEVYQSPGTLTGISKPQSGYLNGSIHGGTLNMSWKSDSTTDQATFNGTVDGNGNLAGNASFSNGENAPFVGKNKMVCQDAPPPQQQQKPADNGSAPPQQGPQQSALPKITGGDVDLYTQPGGVGSPVGVVKNGTSVEVLERRPDNWVHVSFFIMTKQANGWVWGDYVPKP